MNPPFLRAGGPLAMRALVYRGEPRWWFTRGTSERLTALLRCAVGRRWPIHALRARLFAPPAVGMSWSEPMRQWLRTLGLTLPTNLVVQRGSPGRYRKYVAIADAEAGGWVLKASDAPDSCASIAAEAEALAALGQGLPSGFHVPRLLGLNRIDGVIISVQEACLKPGRPDSAWSGRHARFCQSLFPPAAGWPVSGGWTRAIARREALRERLAALGGEAGRIAATSARLLAFASPRLGAGRNRLGWVHRDFTPWNILSSANAITVVDWEWADPEWVPLHDAFHFHIFPRLLHGESLYDLWRELSRPGQALGGLAALLALEEPLEVYAALYLYDVLLFYADAIASEPGRDFRDPLLGRLLSLAERWLTVWNGSGATVRVAG